MLLEWLEDEALARTLHEDAELQWAALLRALDEADREGLAWTPLLDRLASRDLWPSSYPEHPRHGTAPRIDERLAPLKRWLAETPPETDVIACLGAFETPLLRRWIASHAPVLTPAILQRFRDPELFPLVARNPALSRDDLMGLLRRAIETMVQAPPSADVGRRTVEQVFGEAGKRELQLSMEEVDELVALVPRHAVPTPRRRTVMINMASCVRLPPDQFLPLMEEVRDDAHTLTLLASRAGEDVPLEFFLKAARTPWQATHQAVARHAVARRDPEIRTTLLRGGTFGALRSLMQDTTPEECPRLLEAMLEASPEGTCGWLVGDGLPSHLTVDPDWLRALLSHPHAPLREAAMKQLPRVAPDPRRPDTDPRAP